MGLATNVLRKTAVDLFFFGITFIISMLAFSMMLSMQAHAKGRGAGREGVGGVVVEEERWKVGEVLG